MRVLHVINALGIGGGAEHSLAASLPLLRARGISSNVACFVHRDVGLQHTLPEQGFPVEMLRGRGVPGRVRALRRKVRAERPDVVHASLFDSCLASRLACIGLDVAVVNSRVNVSYDPLRLEHTASRPWRTRLLRAVDGVTARHLVDRVHVGSRVVRDETVELLGVSPDKVVTIPRGRSSATLGEPGPERRAKVRADLGVPETAPVLLNVGRQDHAKAHTDLVRAVARIRRDHPDVLCVIAGREGDASGDIARAIEETGTADVVRLLGHRSDIGDLQAAADVFVFPSLYEGLPGSILEAMALGVPVVGSDFPAIAEMLADGRDGVVVPRRDVEGLARAVGDLLDDPERRAELSRRGRERFRDTYEIAHVADATADLYRQVVRERRSGRR